MDRDAVLDEVVARLDAVGTPERAEHEKGYLRSDLDFLGASVPAVRGEARRVHREQPDLDHDAVLALVATAWDAGIHELRLFAVELLAAAVDVLDVGDADRLAQLCREARTWALVDTLATAVVGGLVERDPDGWDPVLRRWAQDDDLWVRRASLLAHLVPLRRGEGDFERFGQLADGMLDEQEFFIRKAIGWVLRETGKRRPELVVDWLRPRLDRASGLTIREATRRLPASDRRALLG